MISARKVAGKKQMLGGHSKTMSDKRYSTADARQNISTHFKDLWNNPQYRKSIVSAMKVERATPKAKIRMKLAAKKKWDSLNERQRRIISDTMKSINSDESKRADASQKIRNLWQTTNFKDKMKKRKPRGPDGSKLKELWADPVWRKKMLDARQVKNETN